jgi:hypothetical protein
MISVTRFWEDLLNYQVSEHGILLLRDFFYNHRLKRPGESGCTLQIQMRIPL